MFNRYARTDGGEIIIDVAAARVQDLYNDFDRHAPYVRRDLDQDLAEYLMECAREIGSRPFAIRISLSKGDRSEDEGGGISGHIQDRVHQSIQNFFSYLGELERRKIRRAGLASLIFLVVGLCFFAANTMLSNVSGEWDFPWSVLREGLTVAAWIALWESLATFIVRWGPLNRSRRTYRRLAKAPVSIEVRPT